MRVKKVHLHLDLVEIQNTYLTVKIKEIQCDLMTDRDFK